MGRSDPDAELADSNSADSNPAGSASADSGPADPGPTDADPTNSKPADSDPNDSEPADSDSTDSDSADSGPTDSDPTDSDPTDSDPTDSGLADSVPVDSAPIDSEPAAFDSADSDPAASGLAGSASAGSASAGSGRAGSAPADSDPTDPKPAVADLATESADVAPADSDPDPDRRLAEPNATTGPADPTDTQQPTQPSQPSPHSTDKRSATFGKIRLARAYLMRVAEPPATALLAFVDAVGPVEAAKAVRAADVSPRVLAETSARRHLELAESDLADAARAGARLVVPEDEEWPAWPLLCLAAACDRGQRWAGSPLGLWVRGPAHVANTFERAVSVVGARSATGYGEFVAADIAHGLAAADMTVVSGAAYGIDGCAHRGAIAAEGTTVAVLGCGVDVGYPAGHTNLIDRIAASGLVLSEYPPGTSPAKHRFLVRNRLIAALSSGTVVVEAGIRSGARNTATTAAALGKVVLAVPGPITSAASAGCHDLLRTGSAMLAGSIQEILEAVGPVGEHLNEPPTGPTRRTDGLASEALRVHEALRRRVARTPAQVAVESGVPIGRVRALLPELELTGLAERCEEGWRQTPEP